MIDWLLRHKKIDRAIDRVALSASRRVSPTSLSMLVSIALLGAPWGYARAQGGAASADAATPAASAASFRLDAIVSRMDTTALVVVFVAVLVMLLLAWRVWELVRRERRAKLQERGDARPAPQTTTLHGSAPTTGGDWEHAERKRGARDGKSEFADLDLPSITITTTHWPEVENMKTPSQAGWVAGRPPGARAPQPDDTATIYRTGYNPFYRPEERIEVEKVADVVTQAELLEHLGETKQAILLLSRHIREHEKPAPKAWLMLFELYVKTGRETHYKALADGFRVLFNADVPAWSESTGGASEDLEHYPQVIGKVQQLWGMPSCRAFLDSLLRDDRGGSRQGFMLAAYSDILFLIEFIDLLAAMKGDSEERHRIELKLAEPGR